MSWQEVRARAGAFSRLPTDIYPKIKAGPKVTWYQAHSPYLFLVLALRADGEAASGGEAEAEKARQGDLRA
ncbi:hypothetical protein OE750_07650 [Lentibacter sp. XHP0401]|nr:hypothetical protein [Lentibacter sp. XHP0401]